MSSTAGLDAGHITNISKEELEDCFNRVNEAHKSFQSAETAKKEAENKLGEEKKKAEAARKRR